MPVRQHDRHEHDLAHTRLGWGESTAPLGHPKYRAYLEDIRDSGAHLLVPIDNVLDMSKMDTGALGIWLRCTRAGSKS